MKTNFSAFFILFLISMPIAANENLRVTLYVNESEVPLGLYEFSHLYSNSIGYLSTCNHLERITGKSYSHDIAIEKLAELKAGDHLLITTTKGNFTLPINHENQKIHELYVGYRKDGLPNVISVSDGSVQLYAKCQGLLAIKNFTCDEVLSKLLGFEVPDKKICNEISK